MKKIITWLVAFGLLSSTIVPGLAGAETSLEANLVLVQNLTNQIKALQEQILGLQKQQVELQVSTNAAVVEIIQSLREGSEGDQVIALQTLLAADASLYPEGKITGYYGPLTRRAVQRFQAKHGLEQVGFIGPRTRALLNKWLYEKGEHSANGKGNDKHDDWKKDKKDKDDDDKDQDDSRPVISDIVASATTTSADIGWKTNENATGKVYYGTTSPLDLSKASSVTESTNWWNWFNQSLRTNHAVTLNNLATSTTYYYVVESKDSKGNTATSSQQSFMTGTPADTAKPVISSVSASATTTGATIAWATNEAATSKVYYGTSTPLSLGSAFTLSSGAFVTIHSLNLGDLATSTTYYYVVESKDAANNTATSTASSFVTGS